MKTQFERMCEIYREARHTAMVYQHISNSSARIVADDTMKLIEELCMELARVTDKTRQWDEFKNSLAT